MEQFQETTNNFLMIRHTVLLEEEQISMNLK